MTTELKMFTDAYATMTVAVYQPLIVKWVSGLTAMVAVAAVHLLRNADRIMHTWVREPEGWKLIGGMSSRQ